MALDIQTLERFKVALSMEKGRLEKELSRFADPTGAVGDFKTRIADMGTDSDENASEVEEYVDNLAVEQTLEAQLKDVNDALEKMDKGTYGICEKTGKEISLERLEAYPGARTAL